MTRKNVTTPLATVLALALASVAPNALAQARDCPNVDEERKVSAGALPETTWKRLNDAMEMVGEERYNEAYDELVQVKQRAGKDEYLNAIVEQMMGQVEWSRENFTQSLGHFERAVELDALPNKQHFALMYQIAQLYNMQERQDEALRALDMWFCTVPEEEITYAAYVLQASIFSSKEDWANTLTAIDKAISMADEPREPWYQLKLGAHINLEQFPQAAATLEQMIERWPDKKTYWSQLSNIYYRLKQEQKALAIASLAYRKGLFDKQQDLLYLSSLYALNDVPYKAAEVLQDGMQSGVVEPSKKHWQNAADNWYAAEELERALTAFEKAGDAALDGNIDLRRSYILVDMERWDDAKAALGDSLRKGGLEPAKEGEALFLKGMTEFNLGNVTQARQDLQRAQRFDRTREQARQYVNYMNDQLRRQGP